MLPQNKKLIWKCRDHVLPLWKRTHIMGILNLTPDSFSDGGLFTDVDRAVEYALEMEADGADIIDIGGESTRPGAEPVSEAEELARVLPVIERVAAQSLVPISIDTYKAPVAREALAAGASIVNDISGLRFDRDMASVVAEADAGLVIMHIKGEPRNMQKNPFYEDVIGEISSYLTESKHMAFEAGVSEEQIVIDPGIGFGKRVEDNLHIIHELAKFHKLASPILIGPSRKSFIGHVLDLPIDQRLEGTAAAVAISIFNGAHIVRVHDVKEMKRVAMMADAIKRNDAR